ncbi:MAG: hypothetical protein AAF628_23490 [Planctomycetota bacterium]
MNRTRLGVLGVALAAFGCSSEVRGPEGPKLDQDELVATISHGEAVALEDHLAANKWTLFEYTADW